MEAGTATGTAAGASTSTASSSGQGQSQGHPHPHAHPHPNAHTHTHTHSNYITIIPVEYNSTNPNQNSNSVPNSAHGCNPKRMPSANNGSASISPGGINQQTEYHYGEYRREEYYAVQAMQSQSGPERVDNGNSGAAHLYSVSQRLTPYSPLGLGRHDEWGSQRQIPADAKENSLDSLEKQSAAGSNSSTCSNRMSSSSGGTTSTARPEPTVGSSASSTSSATSPPPSGSSTLTPVCVYLMPRVALELRMEDFRGATVQHIMRHIVNCEEMGFSPACRTLIPSVFSVWMCSPLLELQLKSYHRPWDVRQCWKRLLKKYGHATPNRRSRDEPVLRFQRNVFYPRQEEEKIKEGRMIELLYEEARERIVKGRYPCGSARAIALGALQARIQLGPYDPLVHTAHFFRQRQRDFLPAHLRPGWFWPTIRPSKSGADARLLEQFRRAPAAAPPRKLMRKYLELCWPLPFYGAAFFQGQVEQPVRGITSLITHQDIAVLVGINANGVYVIDECECTVLLGLKYEEMSWEYARPSDETDDDCLPCIFLQFMVVENGLRVTKILQVFSKQAQLMETLIIHFVSEFKKRLAADEAQRSDSPQPYDYQNSPGVEDGGDLDSPAKRLSNKTAKLSLATFDERGAALGHGGSWRLAY